MKYIDFFFLIICNEGFKLDEADSDIKILCYIILSAFIVRGLICLLYSSSILTYKSSVRKGI